MEAHTFIVDFLSNTTYSGVLDGSVATINVEESIVSDDDSSTEQNETEDTGTHSPSRWETATPLGPVGHPLKLLPGLLRVRHDCGFERGEVGARWKLLSGC